MMTDGGDFSSIYSHVLHTLLAYIPSVSSSVTNKYEATRRNASSSLSKKNTDLMNLLHSAEFRYLRWEESCAFLLHNGHFNVRSLPFLFQYPV